ncbi:MAG: sensor histidine kinase [Cyanobacteria bacterium J06576_12]
MSRAIQLHNHPFRFLLYLEWGLLAVALVSTFESPPMRPVRRVAREGIQEGLRQGPPPGALQAGFFHYSPIVGAIALILFGLLGLYLPTHKPSKIGHTALQLLLLLISSASVLNDGRTFPFVYLVFVIRGCLMYGLIGRLLLTSTAFVLFLVGLQLRLQTIFGLGRNLPPEVRSRLRGFITSLHLNFVVLFGLALLLVVLLINALLTERESQKRLQQANQELRSSAQEIEKLAMDQERSRIARDIHDALGHSLTALNIQLESAVKLFDKEPVRSQQFLANAKRLGTQSLQEVRHSVAALQQDPLAGKSLEEALHHLIHQLTEDNPSRSAPHLRITPRIELVNPLPNNLKILLYRIVQEGLTNIVKHANARQVRLQLIGSAAIVTLTIEDDGQGFDIAQTKSGFGLQSMRDRAESVSGTFTVNSSSHGTRLQVSLPIERR